VTNILGYLGIDVATMTTNDWLGVFFTLFTFVGMAAVYVTVFRPANKERFEAQRSMALDDDYPITLGEKRER
jgi:cbb3-type cytochrome oxidase subunit 3